MSHEPYDPEYIDHERESEDAMERMTLLFGEEEGDEYLVERWADGRWTLSVREAFDAWSPKIEGVSV